MNKQSRVVQSPSLTKKRNNLAASSVDVPGHYFCTATFAIRGQLNEGQHVRLLGKTNSGWDYANGWDMKLEGDADGADTPVWTVTIPITLKAWFEYAYVATDGSSFLHLTPAYRFAPRDESADLDDGNFGLMFRNLPAVSAPSVVADAKEAQAEWTSINHHFRLVLGFSDAYVIKPGEPKVGIEVEGRDVASVRAYAQTGSERLCETILSQSNLHQPLSFRLPRITKTTAFHFDLLDREGAIIGKAASLVSGITKQGVTAIPVIDTSSFVVIGTISFQYTYTSPFVHPSFASADGAKTKRRSSFTSEHVLVGHRGSGSSVSQSAIVDGYIRSHIKENTVFSFSQAGVRGAKYVEFDVQMTSDMVPVIYHDFAVHLEGVPAYPIHRLTLEEFQALGGLKKATEDTKRAFRDHLPPLPAHRTPIYDAFPTLKDTLTKVPKNIGFNIEIKYPIKDETEKHNVHPVDRNTYLDRILWDVFEFAQDRNIVFSSFDPDICLMLMQKQPVYPVMFLTQLGMHLRSDPRCNSPAASIEYAKSNGMSGLVSPAAFLLANPDVIKQVRKAGLMLGSWGADNNNPAMVQKQLDLGLNAAIVDHVNHIAKHWTDMIASVAAATSAAVTTANVVAAAATSAAVTTAAAVIATNLAASSNGVNGVH